MSSPARDCLRRATREDHARLNRHPLLANMTHPDYPLDSYLRVLLAYFHFYRVLEVSIDEALSSLTLAFDYRPRRKLPWLVEDLAHFGLDPDAPGVQPSSAFQLPCRLNADGVLGVLYTIEGSSLGGQVISRHLGANPALGDGGGTRFFRGYGEDVDVLWLELVACLDEHLVGGEARRLACDSARLTFASLERLLDDYARRSQVFR